MAVVRNRFPKGCKLWWTFSVDIRPPLYRRIRRRRRRRAPIYTSIQRSQDDQVGIGEATLLHFGIFGMLDFSSRPINVWVGDKCWGRREWWLGLGRLWRGGRLLSSCQLVGGLLRGPVVTTRRRNLVTSRGDQDTLRQGRLLQRGRWTWIELVLSETVGKWLRVVWSLGQAWPCWWFTAAAALAAFREPAAGSDPPCGPNPALTLLRWLSSNAFEFRFTCRCVVMCWEGFSWLPSLA